MRKRIRQWAFLLAGSMLSALTIVSFVRTAGLFPGGFSGISLLLQELFTRYLGITPPYTVFLLGLNAIAAGLSFRFIGKRFAMMSIVAVALSGVLADVLPTMKLADDPLLNSVFGGWANGVSATLCLLAGASLGGTDFISIYISEHKGRDAFPVILAGNVIMLSLAGAIFSWERALYSMIFQYVTTQVLHTLFRRYQQRTMWIVTDDPDKVYGIIRDRTHHGATLFQGQGLYQNQPRSMIYTVVAADEVRDVVREVRKKDPRAFINTQRTDSLVGSFYRRPQE